MSLFSFLKNIGADGQVIMALYYLILKPRIDLSFGLWCWDC